MDLRLLVTLVFGILALIALVAGVVWFLRLPPRPPAGELPPDTLAPKPVLMRFHEPVPFRLDAISVRAQAPAWREQMQEAGHILKAHRVAAVVFLHGTFTGSDPFDVLPSLRSKLPGLHRRIEAPLQNTMRKMVDGLARDNGNFLPEYIRIFAEATGLQGHCHHYAWSSANHHAARLRGALGLIEKLSILDSLEPLDRVLLIGHSHARQVFALFTHLLAHTDLGENLWRAALDNGLAESSLQAHARRLNGLRFDFVTLGGPVRYSWAFLTDMRALHIVNHRGASTRFEKNRGFWRTESGDYIQQWGTFGSDALAASLEDRQLNRHLDQWLGKGLDTRLWIRTVSRRERLGNFGHTLLVDYGDSTKIAPNFIASVFGHGVYTRYRAMLFNLRQICRYIYGHAHDGDSS